jgi:hypothetical protein
MLTWDHPLREQESLGAWNSSVEYSTFWTLNFYYSFVELNLFGLNFYVLLDLGSRDTCFSCLSIYFIVFVLRIKLDASLSSVLEKP